MLHPRSNDKEKDDTVISLKNLNDIFYYSMESKYIKYSKSIKIHNID